MKIWVLGTGSIARHEFENIVMKISKPNITCI